MATLHAVMPDVSGDDSERQHRHWGRFLVESEERLTGIIKAAVLTMKAENMPSADEEPLASQLEDILYSMSYFMHKTSMRDTDRKEEKRRTLLALIHGLYAHKIELPTVEEMFAVAFVVGKSFWETPEIVEHYVQTGELLDVVVRFYDQGHALGETVRHHLQALYDYDMSINEHEQLPLEIRMNFAGCFDDINSEQVLT